MILAITLSYLSTDPEKIACDEQVTTYVATNGVHLYIILPVNRVADEILENHEVRSNTRYISFGWGDKEFYINTPKWSDLTLGTALTALFVKSPAALHLMNHNRKRDHWVELKICPAQLEELNEYISNYFQKDEGGYSKVQNINGYSANDHFYLAKGNYTLYRTSNVWVNQALKEIQVETSLWSPFDFGVLHHVKKIDNSN